jgi:hypothetical protein
MPFVTAKPKRGPIIMSLAGGTSSGKSLGALLLARAFVGPEGRIAVIDTENERSRIYAGRPDVGEFDVFDIFPPFRPSAYMAALAEAIDGEYDALVIDSMTHEWSGIDGCIEWAEALEAGGMKSPRNWIKPKREHRKLVARVLAAPMHVICCFRAQKKMVPYLDDRGKQQFKESEDLIPDTEKNFPYEFLVSGVIDAASHTTRWPKAPDPVLPALPTNELITIEVGEGLLAAWKNSGHAVDPVIDGALRGLRSAAGDGMQALQAAWRELKDAKVKRALKPALDGELKALADRADAAAKEADAGEESRPRNIASNPLDDDVLTLLVNGEPLHYADPKDLERDFPSELDGVPIEKRGAFWDDNEPLFAMLRQRDLASVADKLLELREAA